MASQGAAAVIALLAGALLVVALGCATGMGLTREQVIAQNAAIAELDARLTAADQEGLALLAPGGVSAAREKFEEAVANAQRGLPANAERFAKEGLERLARAERDSRKASEALRDVLARRQRAVVAGAPHLFPKRFEALDDQLRDAARLAESGDLEGARDAGPELLEGYSSLELESLQVDATGLAQEAIDDARDAGAERYASDTFKRAKKELSIALGILEADRSQVARANLHARKASDLAARSKYIAELVKEFDRRDYDSEDIVLWYQEQIEALMSPLTPSMSFTEPNHQVISAARDQIASLVEAHRLAEEKLAAAEARIADLELSTALSEQAQREAQARYDRIQAMFSEDEATVYRQGANVLLEVHGFDFPVGQSEIQSSNFPLLNKIARAIREFDDPRVIVTGHTDSTGAAEANQKLSEDRARKVGDFLVEVAGMDPARVSTRGFGESKPVATNETAEGRARNRRIEILIVN